MKKYALCVVLPFQKVGKFVPIAKKNILAIKMIMINKMMSGENGKRSRYWSDSDR